MATSNDITWEQKQSEIIDAALRKIGVLSEGDEATEEQYDKASRALNGIMSFLVTKGMPLWKQTIENVALVAGQTTYTIEGAVNEAQLLVENISTGVRYNCNFDPNFRFQRLNQTTTGSPTQYTYRTSLGGVEIIVWPKPDSSAASQYKLVVVTQKEFDGLFEKNETPDFPPYWTLPLTYQLAVTLAPDFGLPLEDRKLLLAETKEMVDAAVEFSSEPASLFIQPASRPA